MYLKDFIDNLEGSLGGVTLHNGQLFSPPFFPPPRICRLLEESQILLPSITQSHFFFSWLRACLGVPLSALRTSLFLKISFFLKGILETVVKIITFSTCCYVHSHAI